MSHAFLPNVGSSHVENIKKRFETNTSSSGSDSVSPRNSPERCAPTVVMRNSLGQPAKLSGVKKTSPTIRNTIGLSNPSQSPSRFNGKTRTTSPARLPVKYDRHLTGSSSRGNNVKRSPAFRCDKIVKGRNVIGNSRLSGERPRSYLDQSKDDFGTNKSNIKRLNSSPTKPMESVPKRRVSSREQDDLYSTDELSSVFSQRNLKPSDKPVVPNPNPKPEILQKPQMIVGISPKFERTSPSRSTNNNPNSPQLPKPPLSTNMPRPAEYAVVEKRNALCDPRQTHLNATKSDSDRPKPAVRLRPRLNNKPAVDYYSKSLTTTTTEQSPNNNVLSSCTKDLAKKSGQLDIRVTDSDSVISRSSAQTNDVSERANAVTAEPLHEDCCVVQDAGRLQLTNTLKKALSSPLPAGPPPKKPPRTFAHTGPGTPSPKSAADRGESVLERIQRLNDVRGGPDASGPATERSPSGGAAYGRTRRPPQPRDPARNNAPENGPSVLDARPNRVRGIRNVFATRKSTENLANLDGGGPRMSARSRTESEIMLKKLENVLRERQNAGTVLRPKSPAPPPGRNHRPPDNNKLFGGCLESIGCVGVDPTYARTSNFYEKLDAKSSEFFVTGYTDLVSNKPRPSSAEHIYAEPFEFGSKSKPRFEGNRVPVLAVTGDRIVEIGHFRDASDAGAPTDPRPRSEGAGPLHYLCTPLSAVDSEMATAGTPVDSEGKEGEGGPVPPLLRLAALAGQDSNDASRPLNQNKIAYLMNQAFSLAALPLDGGGSDSDTPTTPEEATPPAPTPADPGALQDGAGGGGDRDQRLTERRKRYVRRISRLIAPRTSGDFPHLFRYLLLVGLTLHPERKAIKPYVKWRYPPDADVTPHIEDLCFPDAGDWPRPATGGEQSYSLVLTDERGDRTFGYCRRVMPEGTDVCLPLAYCIVSPVRATGFYYKVLSELESRHGQPEILMSAFISELYNSQLPGPGEALKPSSTGKLQHSRTIVRRPLDLRLEERDLTQLFSSLGVPVLLQVFASLLLERKVILLSASLGKLSSCVEALQSILYPFSWQHTFIPVLPSSQLELLDAPTPYIFGVLKDRDGRPPCLSITDGVAADLDSGQLVVREGDEATILPARLRRCLKVALQLVSATTLPGDAARNVLVSEAFVRAFVEACGHYRAHLVAGPDGTVAFQREAFVRASPEPATRHFLEWFTETAMFRAFIEARVEGGPRAGGGMFEQRANERSGCEATSALFLKNSRLVNTRFKALGDRFKDWTPFT